MPSLKELKNRISSVKSTQKITKAMKMVAASKLRRAEEELKAGRPYAGAINQIMSDLVTNIDDSSKPKIMKKSENPKTYLLIVCTGDRGLCGGFNGNIVKKAKATARKLLSEGKTVNFACIGRKSFQLLKGEYESLITDKIDLSDFSDDAYAGVKNFSEKLLEKYNDNSFEEAIIYYAQFQSVITQIVTESTLIPVNPHIEEKEEAEDKKSSKQYPSVIEFEPEAENLLANLCPLYVILGVYKAVKENAASEQGARMSAMENASKNAGEMIDKLTLTFNRARQAQITKELIEVISGAEAV